MFLREVYVVLWRVIGVTNDPCQQSEEYLDVITSAFRRQVVENGNHRHNRVNGWWTGREHGQATDVDWV